MFKLVSTRRLVGQFGDLLGSMGARVLVLPVSGVATILGSRIVVEATGAEGFAWFSLVISLPLLIPISDFGIGAALTDVVATDGLNSPRFWSTLKKVLSLLASISGFATLIAVGMAVFGLWSPLLGVPGGPLMELACAAVALFAAVGIPLGAAQRILLSLGKQTLSTLVLGFGGVWSLSATWVVSLFEASDFALYALAYASGPLVAQILLGIVATRILRKARPPLGVVGKKGKVRVHMVAVPMAIITLSLPLAYQSDRTVLAHVSSMDQLASYSLVGLIYTPLLSILSVGGQTLWPMFMTQKESNGVRKLYWHGIAIFAILGIVLASGLIVLGPAITHIVKGNDANLSSPISTYILFGMLLLLFAAHTTNGMLLMDERGRKLQAVGSVALLVVKVPLSIYLGSHFGAEGVIASTIVAVTLCLFIPACVAAPRYWQRRPVELTDQAKTSATEKFAR